MLLLPLLRSLAIWWYILTIPVQGTLTIGFAHPGLIKMPARSRLASKSSTQSHRSRHSKPSISSRDLPSAISMDIRDSDQAYSSFPSSLPYRHSNRDQQIAQWLVAKDQLSCNDMSYPNGHRYMTTSDASFLANDVRTTSGISWDNAMPMDHLVLDQCQSYVTNDPYQLPGSSRSSTSGSHPVFDPLTIDPSMNLSNAIYSGSDALAVEMTENCFESDFASGSISYDSHSPVYMSPPVSPEIQGQNWAGLPTEYGADGEYATYGTTNLGYSQLGVVSRRPSSPLSPPMSEGDSHVGLASVRHPSVVSHLTKAIPVQAGGLYKIKNSQGRYRDSESAILSTSTRMSSSSSQSASLPSRPAHRILKPASEKPRGHDQLQPAALSLHTRSKEKPETAQPRNHHLYKALPGKDGLFRCPFAKETACGHPPTKQKCGYE
jgi:hypothetical protein